MNSMQKISLTLVAFVSFASTALAGGGYKNSAGYQMLNSSRSNATRTYAVPAQAQTRQSYSYEPALVLKAGDRAVLAKAGELRVGTSVLASLPQGTRITVVAVQGNWIGTNVEQNGQKLSGWIANTDLANNSVTGPVACACR
jgi:homogentisate 1,2-dioxygenase